MKKTVFFIFCGLFLPSISYALDSQVLKSVYRKRFNLNSKGVPIVKIGIKQGLKYISISSKNGVKVWPNGVSGLNVSGSSHFKIKLIKGEKAKLNYFLTLFSKSNKNPQLTKAEKLKIKNYKINKKEEGFIIAIGGKILDTRRMLYSIGPYKSYKKIAKLKLKLIKKFPHLFIHTRLLKFPDGLIRATSSKGITFSGISTLRFSPSGKTPLIVKYGNITKSFPGNFYITIDKNGKLALVNEMPINRYIAGILPSELFPSAPYEALKAQAVAARGQVLSKMGRRHHGDPFHLCSSVHCQVYDGLKKFHKRTTLAVEKTKGEVLFDKYGYPVDTVYSSSCGGHSEHNENVWGGKPISYLRGKPDGLKLKLTKFNLKAFLSSKTTAFCKHKNRSFRWRKIVAERVIRKKLRSRGLRGKIKHIKVLKRGVSGRATKVHIFANNSIILSGELIIRRAFGGLKSSMFLVKKVSTQFVFTGGGFGHGVGMCQWGAINRAKAHQKYKFILNHYYPKTLLKKLY
jgi:SpoIID/LytB domain protein